MGQKVNPIAFRVAIKKSWNSCWYRNPKSYSKAVVDDLKVYNSLEKLRKEYGVAEVYIDRIMDRVVVTVFTNKPGLFIKKAEGGIDLHIKKLSKMLGSTVSMNVKDVKNSYLSAGVIAGFLAHQIEKRASHPRAIKKSISDAIKFGALGIKISVSGRLAGAEIARTEVYSEGKIPLHEMRANIDYSVIQAHTTYGVIGIKVWVNNKSNYSSRNI